MDEETNTIITRKGRSWASKFLSFYFVFFSALYFTGSDISPATTFSWRYILAAFCFACAVLAIKFWKTSWQIFWIPVLFLGFVEVALTMGATEAFFSTPGNVDFFTLLAFNQNPEPFYIIGFKARALWFLGHLMAVIIWYAGKPREVKEAEKAERRAYPHHAHRRWAAGLAGAAVFFVVFFVMSPPEQVQQGGGDVIEAQEEEVVSDSAQTVSDAILNGKTCFKEVDDMWTCDYKVGNDLAFSITKNGMFTELVIQNKGQAGNSDYYLELDSLPVQPIGLNSFRLDEGQGCLLVKAGGKKSGKEKSQEIYSKGYISPKNGNSYSFLNDCTKTIAPQL